MKKADTRGIALVGILVTVLVIGLIGATGWYVYGQQKDKSPAADKSAKASDLPAKAEPPAPAPPPDPTASWKEYTNIPGKFTLRYPTAWVTGENPEACFEGTLLLAPSSQTLGKCATEHSGHVVFSSEKGDVRENYKLNAADHTDLKTKSVTIAGVSAERQSGTVKMTSECYVGCPEDGTKVVRYVFSANGRTYAAMYNQEPGDPDALSDFELIVTKTWQFTK